MKKPLIMFGTGKIGEVCSWFFDRDSAYELKAFIVDAQYLKEKDFRGRPVFATEEALQRFKPEECMVFVALGYQGMNSLRAQKFHLFQERGFQFASYVSPEIKVPVHIGKNSIIMDGVALQPNSTIRDDVFVWGGTMIGHHAVIEDHCWLTGSCAIGGSANIGRYSFVGLGAIVGHEVEIGEKCMLGAGTVACRTVPDGAVLVAPNTDIHRLNSDQFTRMSTCFRV